MIIAVEPQRCGKLSGFFRETTPMFIRATKLQFSFQTRHFKVFKATAVLFGLKICVNILIEFVKNAINPVYPPSFIPFQVNVKKFISKSLLHFY
jgi:hypothetical protein